MQPLRTVSDGGLLAESCAACRARLCFLAARLSRLSIRSAIARVCKYSIFACSSLFPDWARRRSQSGRSILPDSYSRCAASSHRSPVPISRIPSDGAVGAVGVAGTLALPATGEGGSPASSSRELRAGELVDIRPRQQTSYHRTLAVAKRARRPSSRSDRSVVAGTNAEAYEERRALPPASPACRLVADTLSHSKRGQRDAFLGVAVTRAVRMRVLGMRTHAAVRMRVRGCGRMQSLSPQPRERVRTAPQATAARRSSPRPRGSARSRRPGRGGSDPCRASRRSSRPIAGIRPA